MSSSNMRENILVGKLDEVPAVPSKVVRIFTSSTFTDTTEERNILIQTAYPELQEYCRKQYGIEFQTLLGQKHGYRPFPSLIEQQEFDTLLNELSSNGHDITLMKQWYYLDTNCTPPKYVLQKITSQIPDFLAQDEQKRQDGRKQWNIAQSKLRNMLNTACNLCLKSGSLSIEQSEKYSMSVTEQEIHQGLLQLNSDTIKRCMCFIRIIDDLDKHLDHEKAARFIDIAEQKVDTFAQEKLTKLRDDQVAKKLGENNIFRHHVQWSNEGGITPNAHRKYLEEFSHNFVMAVKKIIEESMQQSEMEIQEDLTLEIMQHIRLCKERNEVFFGREDIINSIKNLVTSQTNQVVVIHGISGCGKTSVMARCVPQVSEWLKDSENPVIVFRFLGTTPNSCTVLSTLTSICDQLAAVFAAEDFVSPLSWNDTLRTFNDLLSKATQTKPIVLILDSLDQLNMANKEKNLKWLPRKLPQHVHVLVSTLPDEKGILDHLKDLTSNLVEVEELTSDAAFKMIESTLSFRGRTLTNEQSELVKVCVDECRLPLFVKLASEEATLWHSYDDHHRLQLGKTIPELINVLFERVEKNHGELLVRHSLGYLTASENGLSQVELEDLLSLDDVVLDDVFQYHISPVRRIPQLLWVRIENDISIYLAHRVADSISVVYWYHRQFIECAQHRYLANQDFKRQIHSHMVDYYSGKWYNVKKPFRYTEAQQKKLRLASPDADADRLVAAQPLKFNMDETDLHDIRYNIRKLTQLPYHLKRTGSIEELKELIFDYEWLFAKLCAISPQSICNDLDAEDFSQDDESSLLKNCIRIAQQSLLEDPSTLSTEIAGNLIPYCRSLPYPKLDRLISQVYDLGSRHNYILVKDHMYTAVDGPLRSIIDHPDLPNSYHNILYVWEDMLLVLLKMNKLLLVDTNTGEVDREINLPAPAGKMVNYNVMYLSSTPFTVVIGDATQQNVNSVVLYDIKSDEIVTQVSLEKVYANLGFYENLQIDYDGQLKQFLINSVNKETDCFNINGKLVNSLNFVASSMLTMYQDTYVVFSEKGENELVVYDMAAFVEVCKVNLTGIPKKMILAKHAKKIIVMFDQSSKFNVIDLNYLEEQNAPMKNVQASSIDDMLKGIRPKNITDISVSEDNAWLLIHVSQKVMLYNLSKLQLQKEFRIELDDDDQEQEFEVKSFIAALTTDNKSLIVGFGKKLLHYSVGVGSLIHKMNMDTSPVAHIFITKSHSIITATEKGRLLKIWNLDKLSHGHHEPLILSNPIMYIDSAVKSSVAAIRSSNPEKIYIFNMIDGRHQRTIKMKGGSMAPIVSHSGNAVMLRHYESQDGAIEVWPTTKQKVETDDGKDCQKLAINSLYLKFATLSGSGKLVATSIEDENAAKIQTWNAKKGSVAQKLKTKEGNVADMIFVNNDKVLVVTRQSYTDGKDWSVSSYKVNNGKEVFTKSGIRANCAWTHESGRIVCIVDNDNDPYVQIINGLNGEPMTSHRTLPDHQIKYDAVYMVNFDDTGSRMIDYHRRVIDVCSGQILCHFEPDAKPHTSRLRQRSPKLTQNGEYAAWVDSKMSSVKIGKISTGKIVGSCALHAVVHCLRLGIDDHLIIGCADGRIAFLQLADPESPSFGKKVQYVKGLIDSKKHKPKLHNDGLTATSSCCNLM